MKLRVLLLNCLIYQYSIEFGYAKKLEKNENEQKIVRHKRFVSQVIPNI